MYIDESFVPVAAGEIKKTLLFSGKVNQYCISTDSIDRYIKVDDKTGDLMMECLTLINGERNIKDIQEILDKKNINIKAIEAVNFFGQKGFISNIENKSESFSEVRMLSIPVAKVKLEKIVRGIEKIGINRILIANYILIVMFLIGIIVHMIRNGMSSLEGFNTHVMFSNYISSFLLMLPFFCMHEVAHAIMAIKCGLRPHSINVSLYFGFIPMFFVKTHGIYTRTRKQRVMILSAGVISNFLVCVPLYYFYLITQNSIWMAMLVANIRIGIVNLIPFGLTDGYFLFTNLIKEVNLRKKFILWVGAIGSKQHKVKLDIKSKIYILTASIFMLIYSTFELQASINYVVDKLLKVRLSNVAINILVVILDCISILLVGVLFKLRSKKYQS